MTKLQPNWHILGAGSMGCLWAGSLAQAGESPCLLLQDRRFQKYQPGPVHLVLTSPSGETETHKLPITSVNRVAPGITKLLVCTKAGDALEAVNSLKDKLANGCHIVLLQNGMGTQQAITDAFPRANVWAACATDGAWLREDFDVQHAGRGLTWIGLLDHPGNSSKQSEALTLDNCPLAIRFTGNILTKLWEKLAVNAAINGLSALYDCKNGELLDNGERQQQLDGLIDETAYIMAASRVKPGNLSEVVYKVCQNTALNYSSTCIDRRLQRKTELAHINGFLIATAQSLGHKTPRHEHLLSTLAGLGVKW